MAVSLTYLERLERQNILQVILLAKDRPCLDCHGVFPSVAMDFDHVRGVKLFNLSGSGSKYPLSEVLAEIEKCEVVCANCHRVRTAVRRGQSA